MQKIVVGMSGGVDSTLTAAKLKEAGYEVIGVTLLMWETESSSQSISEAQQQARSIGIEHHILDCRSDFLSKIVAPFTNSYLCGETPSPCAWCNPLIKWNFLAQFADSIGAFYISTGHYIDTVEHKGHYYIRKGIDPVKDQSYYLWMVPESLIKRMVQPLGGITKQQTREQITERSLNNLVPNKESMSVCFLAGKDYRDFLHEQAPDRMGSIAEGNVIDEKGEIIGSHRGFPYYTIGQKRGMNLFQERDAYVTKIDSSKNQLTIGKKCDLLCKTLQVRELHLIAPEEITPTTALEVKVRGLGLNPEGAGYLTFEGSHGSIILENPAWAISPGQPVVFYIDGRVIGGGIAIV